MTNVFGLFAFVFACSIFETWNCWRLAIKWTCPGVKVKKGKEGKENILFRFDLLVKVFFVFKSIITKLGYKSTLRISPCSLNIQQIGRTMKLYETPLWKLSRLDVKASSSFFSSVFRSAKHRWERNNSRGRDENAQRKSPPLWCTKRIWGNQSELEGHFLWQCPRNQIDLEAKSDLIRQGMGILWIWRRIIQ